jgi:CheY-like chemotaxis protein
MDLGMPNKDGFEASEEILRIQKDGNCSIVALTSFQD